ncbi:MAG: GNAT family N-acetyltransferase [Alphaproteobacteria bacterium]|nr:GNAT family N-acetyltransferase [Alphaproteobacteria bacterium]
MASDTPRLNSFGQPIGADVPDWTPPPLPPREAMEGQYCRIEPLDPERHGEDLFEAFAADPEGRNWTYRIEGPFDDRAALDAWLAEISVKADPLFFAYIDRASGKAVGNGAFMRIDAKVGAIEVGSIMFSPLLQRSRIATEVMYLKMKRVFELGYRRYEWKCDALNAPSRRAAQRLGFSYEGVFRQATMYRGRNRDTAWYACIDAEWPQLRAAFETWLDPENFDAAGQQKLRLSDLTAPILVARG